MASIKENKFSLGYNKGGRPPTFPTPEDLELKCNEYLIYCIDNEEKPTITGMTLLGYLRLHLIQLLFYLSNPYF